MSSERAEKQFESPNRALRDSIVRVDPWRRRRLHLWYPDPDIPPYRLARDGATRLIIPPCWGVGDNRASLGIAYLAGALRDAGVDTHVVDLAREKRVHDPELYEKLASVGFPNPNGGLAGPRVPLLLQVVDSEAWGGAVPELARRIEVSADEAADRLADPGALHGLIVADVTAAFAFALGSAIRRRGGRVAFGGPTMNDAAVTELALRCGAADAVVRGSGEAAIVQLARACREETWCETCADDVPGLHVLDGGELRGQPIWDGRSLAGLPRPDWRGQQLPPSRINLMASRGCVRRCAFCSEPNLSPLFAARPPSDVVAEMDALTEQHGMRHFEFNDDLLNGSPRWLRAFCRLMIERGTPYTWQGLFRPDRLRPEILAMMNEAGCRKACFGVQHLAPEVLRLMGRGEDPDEVCRLIGDTFAAGIAVGIDILPGFPGETDEAFAALSDRLAALFAEHPSLIVAVSPYAFMPGSAVALDPDRYGVTVRRFDEPLPSRLEPLRAVVERFPDAVRYQPEQRVVIDRAVRLVRQVGRLPDVTRFRVLGLGASTCNNHCVHCDAPLAAAAGPAPLPEPFTLPAIEEGEPLLLGDAEPTLHPDLVEIVAAANARGAGNMVVRTNGRMFAYRSLAHRVARAGLTAAWVGIHGPNPVVHERVTRTPGSFDQTLQGLQSLMLEPGMQVITHTVVSRLNHQHLAELVDRLAGLGVQRHSFEATLRPAGDPLAPPIDELRAELGDALDLAEQCGVRAAVIGLPYCALLGYENHFGVGRSLADGRLFGSATDPVELPASDTPCVQCALVAVCPGLARREVAGFAPKPYPGWRVTEPPDSDVFFPF